MRAGQPESISSDWSDSDFVNARRIPVRQDAQKDRYCVLADLLIPGKGEPIKDGCIIVEGNKIVRAGKASDVAWQYTDIPKTQVKILMPGLWDCHVHLVGIHKVDSNAFVDVTWNQVRTGARGARDAMLLLNSGFTSVREVGGYGLQLDQAITEGSIVGPKIYSANQVISPTGGHGDIHSLHKPWFDDACAHGCPTYTADGVPDCLKAIRMQLRAGANVIKICGSGGVGSERDDPGDQEFSEEEISAMVKEAARARRLIAAHCHGKPGIIACLKNGVKTIEHGSYIDEECADLMKEKDAILVATRLIVENGLAQKEFFTPVGYEKLLKVANAQWKAMQLAIAKGVKIAIGTDTTGTIPGNKTLRFDMCGRELYYHVKAGMTPLQAIEAATANGPLTLGLQAPKAGILKEGYDADFIALDENPLDDIRVLSGPDHVTHVWKQGTLYKSPTHPVTCL